MTIFFGYGLKDYVAPRRHIIRLERSRGERLWLSGVCTGTWGLPVGWARSTAALHVWRNVAAARGMARLRAAGAGHAQPDAPLRTVSGATVGVWTGARTARGSAAPGCGSWGPLTDQPATAGAGGLRLFGCTIWVSSIAEPQTGHRVTSGTGGTSEVDTSAVRRAASGGAGPQSMPRSCASTWRLPGRKSPK